MGSVFPVSASWECRRNESSRMPSQYLHQVGVLKNLSLLTADVYTYIVHAAHRYPSW